MDKFTFSVENIVKGEGIGISLTGMLIVFVALTLIAVFITLLPWVMRKLDPILPKGEVFHAPPASGPRPPSEADESLAAAIGYALYKEHLSQDK